MFKSLLFVLCISFYVFGGNGNKLVFEKWVNADALNNGTGEINSPYNSIDNIIWPSSNYHIVLHFYPASHRYYSTNSNSALINNLNVYPSIVILKEAGSGKVIFDGTKTSGRYQYGINVSGNIGFDSVRIEGTLASGIYFYSIKAGNYSAVKKMQLVR